MRSLGNQRGQSLLEFALLAPFVLFFLLALVDFGIAIDRRIVLDHAVREGARYAAVGGEALNGAPADASAVRAYTSAQSQGILDSGDIDVCYTDQNADGTFDLGDAVKVSARYEYAYVTGFNALPGIELTPTIPMNVNASARAEYAITGTNTCP